MKWKERVGLILVAVILLCILNFSKKTGKVPSSHPGKDDIRSNLHLQSKRFITVISEEGSEYVQNTHPWNIWENMVEDRAVTSKFDNDVDAILMKMNKAKILKVDVGHKGTQLKAQVTLSGPKFQEVVFKPKRYSREKVLEGTPYEGFDRHNGEIAAFHLDRLLGFYRAPPVVGRIINLRKEAIPVTEKKLLKTFYYSNDNLCFYGQCMYCKKRDSACGVGDEMEGSLTAWLPMKWKLYKMRHPWQRTYTKRKAKWEINSDYCNDVISKPPYNDGSRLLDLMDTAIFDFLIGNADRHHYEYIKSAKTTMVVHLDNGKSFGNPYRDEMSILAPLKQCCMLRHSTFLSIGSFTSELDKNLSLSYILKQILDKDPIHPILTKDHLKALDRRLSIVFKVLEDCFRKLGKENVLMS